MLPLAIIPGPKKPKDLLSFLKPIIEEIQDLSTAGFIAKKNGDVVYQGKVFLLGITGDIIGIYDLMNHRHTSMFGCRYCHADNNAHGLYFKSIDDPLRTLEELVNGDIVS